MKSLYVTLTNNQKFVRNSFEIMSHERTKKFDLIYVQNFVRKSICRAEGAAKNKGFFFGLSYIQNLYVK